VRCAAGSRVQTRLAGEKQGAHREEEEIGGDNWEQKGHRLLPRGAEHHPTCPTTLSGTYLFYTRPLFSPTNRTHPSAPHVLYATAARSRLASRRVCAGHRPRHVPRASAENPGPPHRQVAQLLHRPRPPVTGRCGVSALPVRGVHRAEGPGS
jgi:hypothetical protein